MIRRLRLASGLAMLAYVTMHLLNHAVGLVSLAAMERVLGWVTALWSRYPMQALLYGAFAVHYALALWSLWQRRSLRLGAAEFTRQVLGFAIPILLVRHVVANRIGDSFLGTTVGFYKFVLWNLFVNAPERGVWQIATLIIAWSHSMMGLHFWLRVRPWYERWRASFLVAAVLIPVLSILGAVEAARHVAALAAQPGSTDTAFSHLKLPSPEAAATLDVIGDALIWFFAGSVAVILLGRSLRRSWQRRLGVVRISYPDGRFVDVLRGTTILEASRIARIPHASVCGGRGRCSTCRVRVRFAGRTDLPSPAGEEARVLARIGALPNVRLACQLRPTTAVEVTPLLPPYAHAADGERRVDLAQGGEREIAILFADIRGFTALAEGRLPYDVVFILNRYFAAMGRAVEGAGGRVDKFIGDGVMALFGVSSDVETGCRQALVAARSMSLRLAELNQALYADLPTPLRIGIGIHAGPAIVGEMGYGAATTITAIGDAVNTASRIESLTKEFGCEVLVSEEVVARAGLDRALFRWEPIEVRGKQEKLAVAIIDSGSDLPLEQSASTAA